MSQPPELHIIKIGGKVMASPDLLDRVLARFVDLPERKILVHGGGNRASALSEKLGLQPRMHQGRRLTDADALEVAVMVYAGLANKELVASLQARGCNALGISGADANAISAEKRAVRDVDFGFVGDIARVNADMFATLLEAGISPVCCAITHDGRGQLYNTNADTIAAHISQAMARSFTVHLSYCFERPGVLRDPEDDGSLIPRISRGEFQRFAGEGIIHSGMLPKLDNAFQALAAGVASVAICGPAGLHGGPATQLVP